MTMGDMIVIAALVLIIGLIVRGMIRDKKAGKCSGCSGCSGCTGCAGCPSRGCCGCSEK